MSILWRTVLAAMLAAQMNSPASAATLSGAQALARYKAAWHGVNAYRCSITAREALGKRVQDRAYDFWFSKPHEARLEITGGEGRGGAAVWIGGGTLRAHQGGWTSFVKLRLDIHDPRVTSIRGTTIAQANFGALYEHLTSLRTKSLFAVTDGAMTTITAIVADPAADEHVTKEVMTLGADDLPVEYDEFEGAVQVKRVRYSDVQVNLPIPASEFSL